MIGMILVCHGGMAAGLLDAMQMITGEQEACRAIGLEETESVENLMEKVQAALEEIDNEEGSLIFVDLFGASPFNTSARLVLATPSRPLEVITGVNLPMLVELAVQREGLSLAEAAELARSSGMEGIRRLSELPGFTGD